MCFAHQSVRQWLLLCFGFQSFENHQRNNGIRGSSGENQRRTSGGTVSVWLPGVCSMNRIPVMKRHILISVRKCRSILFWARSFTLSWLTGIYDMDTANGSVKIYCPFDIHHIHSLRSRHEHRPQEPTLSFAASTAWRCHTHCRSSTDGYAVYSRRGIHNWSAASPPWDSGSPQPFWPGM